ncbi:MAG: hypothetical protein ABJC12_05525 [Saprospiraceae bacterium]
MRNKKMYIIGIGILALILLVFLNPAQVLTKTLLRITGDYQTPHEENSESILSKTSQDHLYYDRLYSIRDYKSFRDFQRKGISVIPFVQIYNRDKKMLTNASGSECAWALMNYFAQKDSAQLKTGDDQMYHFIEDRLTPIDIKTDQDTFDYYLFLGWANYIPKLSKNLFIQTNKMAETMKGRVCFSYINFDMQKPWEAEASSLNEKE